MECTSVSCLSREALKSLPNDGLWRTLIVQYRIGLPNVPFSDGILYADIKSTTKKNHVGAILGYNKAYEFLCRKDDMIRRPQTTINNVMNLCCITRMKFHEGTCI